MGAVFSELMIARYCPSFDAAEIVTYSPGANVVVGPPAIEPYVVES